jgi:hypothetical protein
MRKYENVDIVAALGAVVELNTEHYKGDFKYDIERFKEAVKNPDGENNRLLWLSRHSGTWCVKEREAYIKDSEAFNLWNGYATILGDVNSYMSTVVVQDRILTYAVDIKGVENGRIKGDLYELDYRDHIRELNRAALPKHSVTVSYEDGTTLTLPPKEYDGHRERLFYQHGQVKSFTPNPEDEGALRDVLKQAREKRENESRPAVFKLRVKNPEQPSIKQQLAAGKKSACRRTRRRSLAGGGKNKI